MINLFASTPDPDFLGHLLLEQYQAQVRHVCIMQIGYTYICMHNREYIGNSKISGHLGDLYGSVLIPDLRGEIVSDCTGVLM